MPPSTRRRAQPPPPQFHESLSDSEEEEVRNEGLNVFEGRLETELPEELGADFEVDEEDEEEEEGEEEEQEEDGSQAHESGINLHSPIPDNFREISNLASWTVSSSKPGCSIPQLRSPNTSLFWQSDGPQPHYLNIHFFKLVRIVGLRLFLDFDADESYTPTRIVFLAGSGGNDLVEWGEMKLEQPRGWVWADFSGVGDPEDDEDDDDDEDEDMENQETGPRAQQHHANRGHGSDFENAQPAEGNAARPPADDPMVIDFHAVQVPPAQQQQNQTPTHPRPGNYHHATPATNPTPTLHRTHPRRPLHNLTPNDSPQLALPRKTKKVKMPVLRAHLVQIKILENHQNGKDTHLRGLQIFAKDTEPVRPPPREVMNARSSLGTGGLGSAKGERSSPRAFSRLSPTIR